LIIFRNKIFVIWIGLELLVFVSVSIFSIKKSTIFKNFKKMFFYFVIQTLGSLLIIFSFFKKTQILFAIGILIKLGVFPFFFWVPIFLFSLKWQSLFILLVLKKIPLFYIFLNFFERNQMLLIFLFSAFQGIWGLFFFVKSF